MKPVTAKNVDQNEPSVSPQWDVCRDTPHDMPLMFDAEYEMTELFRNLFIFEMANNHQGTLAHGLAIERAMSRIARKRQVRACVKLPYRDLDTFIHADYRQRQEVKHIPRFLSTRLQDDEFQVLVEAIVLPG